MADTLQIQRIEVGAAGGTVNIELSNPVSIYEIFTDGVVTLSANQSFTTETPTVDTRILFTYKGHLTLAGFSFLLLGQQFTQSQLNVASVITAIYTVATASWEVFIDVDDSDQPQVVKGTATLTIPTTGTVTLLPGVDKNFQRSANTVTLTGNTNVAISTTGASENDWFWIRHDGGVTLGGFTLELAGVNISSYNALNGGITVFAFFDGTVWRPAQIGGTITDDSILDGTITVDKFAAVPAYSVYINKTATAAQPVLGTAANADMLLKADGFDLLRDRNFGGDLFRPQAIQYSLSAAEITTGFYDPIQVLPPSGSVGIVNIPHLIFVTRQGAAVGPYTGNTDLAFRFNGAAENIIEARGILEMATNNLMRILYPSNIGTGAAINIVENSALMCYVPVGNPTPDGGGFGLNLVIYFSRQPVNVVP